MKMLRSGLHMVNGRSFLGRAAVFFCPFAGGFGPDRGHESR